MSSKFGFILVKPQLGENIGACARAMKNFGFSKLHIVEPKISFPNHKAKATSVGAYDIINKAKVFNNIQDAIEPFNLVVSLSARRRDINKKNISLKEFQKIIKRRNLNLGLMFGPEASGLSNKEVSYANYTLQIPTNINFKSLNLSHSLIIIAQFISSLLNSKSSQFKKSKKVKKASKKEIQAMINLCLNNLNEINFFKHKEKKPIMLENLRNIFYRMELSDKETRILSSVFASLAKKGRLTK